MSNNRLAVALGGLLAAVLIIASAVVTLQIDVTPKAKPSQSVVRTRDFGENLKLARHGLYGVELVSIGRARMRKLRKGLFSIGAINELVLEDVALVLPEEGDAGGQGPRDDAQQGPREMLSKLGINAGNLRLGDNVPRFSALTIRRLNVSRLDGTNVVAWFAAESGTAERGGLRLKTGWSVENGVSNVWPEARLVFKPTLRLMPREK